MAYTPAKIVPTREETAPAPAEIVHTAKEMAYTSAKIIHTREETAYTPAKIIHTREEMAYTPAEITPTTEEMAHTKKETAHTTGGTVFVFGAMVFGDCGGIFFAEAVVSRVWGKVGPLFAWKFFPQVTSTLQKFNQGND